MGIILFIVFAALEIALAVVSCKKYRDRVIWKRNRLIIGAFDLAVIAFLSFVPVTGQRWRFFGCLIILLIRVLFDGLGFIIKFAKKAAGRDFGEKSTAGIIANAVWSVFILGVALFPAFIFSGYNGLETSGQYKVNETEAILVDSSRIETHENDGSNREVPVHLYYPDGDPEKCPLVVFAHGSFGYYQSNDSLYRELASNGYVVASIDHPYYAFFTTDTNGNIITVDMDFMNTCINMENNQVAETEAVAYTREWLNVRAADENFVIDSIKAANASGSLGSEWFTENDQKRSEVLGVIKMTDTSKIGLSGHSIGGAAGIKLGRERDDISAVIDIDGTMFSEKLIGDGNAFVYSDEPYTVPFLEFNNGPSFIELYNENYRDEQGRRYINVHVLNNAVDGREYQISGTAHMDFTDLPMLSPVLAGMLGSSGIDPLKVIPEVNRVSLNFFNYYLKGEGELLVSKWEPMV